jgi:hypothetical protein
MRGASPWMTAAAALLLRCARRPICVLFGSIVRRGTPPQQGPFARILREGRAAPDGVYKLFRRYALALRATASTIADIPKVQRSAIRILDLGV